MSTYPLKLVIDFDGTIVTNKWPEIGEMMPNAKRIINLLASLGHKIIINTCRSGEHAENARSWLIANGIKFHSFNENLPEQIEFYGSDTRKMSGDIYIDDRQLGGIPEDWNEIYYQIDKSHGTIIQPEQ